MTLDANPAAKQPAKSNEAPEVISERQFSGFILTKRIRSVHPGA